MKTILITGVAGFIGHAIAMELLSKGNTVIGIDNMLGEGEILVIKENRLAELISCPNFILIKQDIANSLWKKELESFDCDFIVHLAAFAGVRKSMQNPIECLQSNVIGFTSVLEFARLKGIRRVVYASSSSVYGDINSSLPSSEHTVTNHPTSIYAASKTSNELLAYVYSLSYGIKTIGLRFFSVYGPYGRPDMAPWIFADSIVNQTEAVLFSNGEMRRDFTYIDEVVDAITKIIATGFHSNYEIYNIGSSNPHSVLELYNTIQEHLGTTGKYKLIERQSGDVLNTHADMTKFYKDFGLLNHIDLSEGIKKFCKWFIKYKATH